MFGFRVQALSSFVFLRSEPRQVSDVLELLDPVGPC